MMQAVVPMRVNLNRFEDSMLAAMNDRVSQQASVYAGLQGLGEAVNWSTYRPTPDDESTTVVDNVTIYTDWSTRRRYVYDDNGVIQWLDAVMAAPTGGGSGLDFGGFFGRIFGTEKAPEYKLPDGSVVTYTPAAPRPAQATQWIKGVPNSYLVLGGSALLLMLIVRRR